MVKSVDCAKCSKEQDIKIIHEKISKMEVMLSDLHKELKGNGRKGLIQQWYEAVGSINTFKWIAGSSIGLSVISLLKSLK